MIRVVVQIKYLISNKNQMINSIRDELLGRKKRAIKKLELELKKFTDKEDGLVTKESIKNIKKDILSKNLDDFDHKVFLENAKFAFETIINAFNKSDKKTLKNLLTKNTLMRIF